MSTRTKGRGCAGKQRHETEAGAYGQLASLVRRRGANPDRYQTYQCQHCDGGWHIGHRPKPRRRR